MARNKQEPLMIGQRTESVALGDVEYALGSHVSNDIKIVAASWIPENAMASTTANSVSFHLINEGSAGTLNTTVASWSIGTATAQTLTAFKRYDLTVVGTCSTVTEDSVLQWKALTVGAGVQWYGRYQYEYIIL